MALNCLVKPMLEKIENPIALGDQSPTAGGLLRLFCSRLINSTVYFHHSTDAAWLQTGSQKISAIGGFQRYWSTASRNPFTTYGFLDIQDHNELIAFGNSVKSPSGLVTLQGPNTEQTFYSTEVNQISRVQDLTKNMLKKEIEWAKLIATKIGYLEGIKIAEEALEIIEKSDGAHIGDMSFELYQALTNPQQSFSSSVTVLRQPASLQVFLQSPLKHQIANYYWEIDLKTGNRMPASNMSNHHLDSILVPKAAMLPIELAMKGYVVGITGMGYATEVVRLRNHLNPDMEIPIAQYKFNMQVPEALRTMWREFIQKRQSRGKQTNLVYENDVLNVLNQWNTRPTYLFALITGIHIEVEVIFHRDISDYINTLE